MPVVNTDPLAIEARKLIREADFTRAWPADVKAALGRAIRTEGTLPPFAAKEVRWALKVARAVERRMNKDIEMGMRNLTQQQRRDLKVGV